MIRHNPTIEAEVSFAICATDAALHPLAPSPRSRAAAAPRSHPPKLVAVKDRTLGQRHARAILLNAHAREGGRAPGFERLGRHNSLNHDVTAAPCAPVAREISCRCLGW